ncbi:uncharacterized protein LOC130590177 [Beta vulgaris subsp. vulgaris]|uniref:uncharacterized protein LOC130590177 n=1 Tax=Beta vulgaris subsp. vulgaris TaxID=3555 RepID=UPI002546BFB3|nr:uncharacterized protein LOC130590177 [Beta vulgaris subsp. vulgaris]
MSGGEENQFRRGMNMNEASSERCGVKRTNEERNVEDEGVAYDSSEEVVSETSKTRRRPRKVDDFRDIKLEIPEFDGNLNPDEYDDAKAFKVVVAKLKGYASPWWENVVLARTGKHKPIIKSWIKLKKKMKEKFLPSTYTLDLYNQLSDLAQDHKGVEYYIHEFEKLMIKLDVQEREEQTMSRFLGGLDKDIRMKVELQPYSTLDELFKLALKVEKHLKEKKKKTFVRGTSYTKGGSNVKQPYTSPYTPKGDSSKVLDKGKKVVETSSKKSDVKCFKCHGYGHYQAQCPNKRVMTLLDIKNIEESLEHEGDNEDELEEEAENEEELEVGEVTQGEHLSLVLRRILHTKEAELIPSQRDQIFQTKCLIGGKICSMIIDGGSCTNVASSSMVNKLNHPTFQHPKPYKLHWLNDGNCEEVTKQALISFSFGDSYKDEVLCDVLPMDALHEMVKPLVMEFGDVFPNDLPSGLPPSRGIEHQIDLIPGATLPNKPAYRCNPEEANELQK